MISEIFIIFILILINGFLAMSEIAIISSKRNKLLLILEKGNHKAATVIELKENPNQYLSTIQVGITLVSILAGAFSGTTIVAAFTLFLEKINFITYYAHQISFFFVVIILTFFTLIGDLVSKRIALHNPEKLAIATVSFTKLFIKITKPIVFLLSGSIELILKTIGHKHHKEPLVSEDEVKFMLDLGTKTGEFEVEEKNMIKRVFHLSEQSVSAIMTPRIDIDFLDLEESPEAINLKLKQVFHSYLPICKGDLDNIQGVVHVKDIISKSIETTNFDLKDIISEPHYISENTSVLKLLETFKKHQIHIAIVIDEYGSIKGLITLTDILGSIVGNIPDEDDYEVDAPIKKDENTWLLDGKLSLIELKETLQVEELPDEERGDYQTLAGFILYLLKKIPKVSEFVEWKDIKFEIVEMEKRRIEKVLVTRIAKKL